jgi:hypothetical protein
MNRDVPLPAGGVEDIKMQHGVMAHAQRIVHPYINEPRYDSLGPAQIVESTTYVLDGGQPDTLVQASDWINAGDLDGGDV